MFRDNFEYRSCNDLFPIDHVKKKYKQKVISGSIHGMKLNNSLLKNERNLSNEKKCAFLFFRDSVNYSGYILELVLLINSCNLVYL